MNDKQTVEQGKLLFQTGCITEICGKGFRNGDPDCIVHYCGMPKGHTGIIHQCENCGVFFVVSSD